MSGLPHPMDVALGASIRIHRESARLSREVLAQECGISTQQLQKYEAGKTRLSFSRLTEIADVLHVSVFELIEPVLGKRPVSVHDLSMLARTRLSRALLQDFVRLDDGAQAAVAHVVSRLAQRG
jgi:transcriptional regulator with XRE-family HTH domain